MNEESIDLSSLWAIIKKKMNVIIIVTILVTMISGIVTFFFLDPKYKSTVAVFINDVKTTSENGSDSQTINDISMYQKLVDTYSEITKSRTVAENVIEELGLDLTPGELQDMISSSPKGNTQFLNISITSKDREQAYQIANQLALSLKTVSKDLRGNDIVQILDSANVPTSPSSPNLKMNLVIGFMLGLMLSVFSIFIMEFMDKTVKDPEFIMNDLELPFLGTLPFIEGAQLD